MMETRQPVRVGIFNYIGPSMNPLLESGDQLEIVSCNREKIRVGDVVVFYSPEDETKVVHRVVCSDSGGIKTRGDNCSHTDDRVLRYEDILGRVISATRGNRRFRVFGGPLRKHTRTDCYINFLGHRIVVRDAQQRLPNTNSIIKILRTQVCF